MKITKNFTKDTIHNGRLSFPILATGFWCDCCKNIQNHLNPCLWVLKKTLNFRERKKKGILRVTNLQWLLRILIHRHRTEYEVLEFRNFFIVWNYYFPDFAQ